MRTKTATLFFHYLLQWLHIRLTAVRSTADTGSHATEYAIGIGLSAAIAILLWGAYRTGIETITSNWFFGNGN